MGQRFIYNQTMRERPNTSAIDEFVFSEVDDHPNEISSLIAERFGVSRQAANAHLRRLVRSGVLSADGKTRNRSYSLRIVAEERVALAVTPDLEEHQVWSSSAAPMFGDLKENVVAICNYGFTEILNNAKDHSEATDVEVWLQR